jgi:hypothetical protein
MWSCVQMREAHVSSCVLACVFYDVYTQACVHVFVLTCVSMCVCMWCVTWMCLHSLPLLYLCSLMVLPENPFRKAI